MLKPIMLAGTGSDVGKSVLVAALCRIFRQDGHRPAPFKAQNMALNSYATPEGLEIGRAQAVQAEAAGIPCHTDMNPLLLKPTSDMMAQVVLNGKPIGNQSAFTYFSREGREELRKEVCAAFDRLGQQFNPIVLEGAGSISEINLKDRDLVNLPMAQHARANVILVADIDRGGVFASVYGSVMLLDKAERELIKGVIINKFRGDIRLFEDGIKLMEERCGIPVLGVVPYFNDIYIEEEDSVALSSKQREACPGKINIAVILLRHMSNFTDFNLLERDERVNLYYAFQSDDLQKANIVIIPGSKSTIADLAYLRETGMAQAIIHAARDGKTIMGICGGYQMMGTEILDPQKLETEIERMPGLGLLPVTTTMNKDKCTYQRQFTFLSEKEVCQGYEIHNGVSEINDTESGTPFIFTKEGASDGCMVNEKCLGTYMHGILDNSSFINFLLKPYSDNIKAPTIADYKVFKEEQYDKLAAFIRKHVDIERIYEIIK
ncbi:MAG: cobyric acid synthase [Bacteroidales bacterium]